MIAARWSTLNTLHNRAEIRAREFPIGFTTMRIITPEMAETAIRTAGEAYGLARV
jgi:hypothetical protein